MMAQDNGSDLARLERMERRLQALEDAFDLMKAGQAGDDPRMYFSWYGADFTTDPNFTDATPEQRANPSMASWGNDGYLD
jgi:hypothetical protein